MSTQNPGARLAVWAVIIVGLILSINLWMSLRQLIKVRERVEVAERKMMLEEDKKIKLEKELVEKTTPDFMEREIRNKLNLAREGETVLMIEDMDQDTSLRQDFVGQAGEENSESMPNWKKWLVVLNLVKAG